MFKKYEIQLEKKKIPFSVLYYHLASADQVFFGFLWMHLYLRYDSEVVSTSATKC